MKLLTTMLMFLLITASAFAQPVSDLDGHDWLDWTPTMRHNWTLGYVCAIFFSAVALYETSGGQLEDPNGVEVYNMLADFTYLSVVEVQRNITLYYADPKNRDVTMVAVPFRANIFSNPMQGVTYHE